MHTGRRDRTPDRISVQFKHFKEQYTFRSPSEAMEGMKGFLQALRAEIERTNSDLLRLIESQCKEAMEDAQKGVEILTLDETETLEWHVDVSGTALEHRLYYLNSVDELTITTAPPHRFPADYTARGLGYSRDRDTITAGEVTAALGIDKGTLLTIVRTLPQQAYTGRLTALGALRFSEGAYLLLKETRLRIGKERWPEMYVTSSAIRIPHIYR